MGDHQPQGDLRVTDQRRAHRGMAMKIDIGLHLGGDFGPGGFRARCLRPIDPRGFLAAHIAFVETDLAARAQLDIDAPALALGGLFSCSQA